MATSPTGDRARRQFATPLSPRGAPATSDMQMGQGMPATNLPKLYKDPVTGEILQEAASPQKPSRQLSLRGSRQGSNRPSRQTSLRRKDKSPPPPAAMEVGQGMPATNLPKLYKDPVTGEIKQEAPAPTSPRNKPSRQASLRSKGKRSSSPPPPMQLGEGMPATNLPKMYKDPVTGEIKEEAPAPTSPRNKPSRQASLNVRKRASSPPPNLTDMQVGQGMPAANLPKLYKDPITGEIKQEAPEQHPARSSRAVSPRLKDTLSPKSSRAGDRLASDLGDLSVSQRDNFDAFSPRSKTTSLLSPRKKQLEEAAERKKLAEEDQTSIYFPGAMAPFGGKQVEEDDDLFGKQSRSITGIPGRTATGLNALKMAPMKSIGKSDIEPASGRDENIDIVAFYHDGIRLELHDLYTFLEAWETASWRPEQPRVSRFYSWWDGFKNAIFEWFALDERVYINFMEVFQASLIEFDGQKRATRRLAFIVAAQAVDALKSEMTSNCTPALMETFVGAIQECYPALLGYLMLKEEMMAVQIRIAKGQGVLQEKHIQTLGEQMVRETLKGPYGPLLLCIFLAPLSSTARTSWLKPKLSFLQFRKFAGYWTQYENHRSIVKSGA
eukprot:CAMPEP_0182448912 /NCGR_PEP_ID=MMETSP1172-20130603/30607_1 /TAXON_ID=708627 /ORGANISM="Timspurckia oligopyrenoides, Strain CCMP3278" /LENGTH=608 /DNA_ID=CAMNT_0024645957 /DNA_START=132 /DNA_END=1958 /DNA_ORIENTATION=+